MVEPPQQSKFCVCECVCVWGGGGFKAGKIKIYMFRGKNKPDEHAWQLQCHSHRQQKYIHDKKQELESSLAIVGLYWNPNMNIEEVQGKK